MKYKKELIESWKKEEAEPFVGWDFSYLDGRMLEDQEPWSYKKRAIELLRHSDSMLDMGTGGGERLLSMQEYWPGKVTVTEDYPPNFQLARQRLELHGVRVTDTILSDDDPLPFSEGEFDLIINRHSSFNCAEVSRILSKNGIFFTEQIHGLWAEDLVAAFGAVPTWKNATLEHYIPLLEESGMTIVDSQDWKGRLEFTDVGAIVYYLKAIPWTVPGFSVQTHLDYLFKLEDKLHDEGELVFTSRMYLIEAVKK